MHHKNNTMPSIIPDKEKPIIDIGADPNNNFHSKRNEKYSLRKLHKRHSIHFTKNQQIDNGISDTDSQSTVERKSKKPKQKTAPLSKYRRKTANARERTRMREINAAFENLRKRVPLFLNSGTPSTTNNEKFTKITTLRLAMKYIYALNELLSSKSGNNNNNNNNNSNFSNSSNRKSINGINTNTKDLSNNRCSEMKKLNLSKNQLKDKSKKKSNIEINYLKKSFKSPCLTPPIDNLSEDLGLILDSDGESLHLSEPCLSPLFEQMKSNNEQNVALEMGTLLESDTDSLQLSEHGLSPFGEFDSLVPFNDLLHIGLNNNSNLDLFLT